MARANCEALPDKRPVTRCLLLHRLNTSCGKPEGTVARYADKLRGYMSQADLWGVIGELSEGRSHGKLRHRSPVLFPTGNQSCTPAFLQPVSFASYRWQKRCRGLYQTPIATRNFMNSPRTSREPHTPASILTIWG